MQAIMAVYDEQAECFSSPWFCVNEQVAKRHFAALAGNPENEIHRNPTDFTLMHFGSWDPAGGKFDLHGVPQRVMTGLEAKVVARKLFAEQNRLDLAEAIEKDRIAERRSTEAEAARDKEIADAKSQ